MARCAQDRLMSDEIVEAAARGMARLDYESRWQDYVAEATAALSAVQAKLEEDGEGSAS